MTIVRVIIIVKLRILRIEFMNIYKKQLDRITLQTIHSWNDYLGFATQNMKDVQFAKLGGDVSNLIW